MAVPVVTIVGRPNVGKSSLFNWLAGRRIAIVDPTAGVTRDRVDTLVKAGDQYFNLIDTGGIGIHDRDDLGDEVERQIGFAIDLADVVLFVVDARDGIMALDEEVASRLRSVGKPVLCVVNKCDTPKLESVATEFFRLGYDNPIPVSAEQKRGRDELLAAIGKHLPAADSLPDLDEEPLKIAIVGRRNTGKSTFINQLAESERMIVSEIPGTTRDSVDVRFERDGKSFIAIDTAGVRRKRSVKGDVEFYSMARAERSIRRADVVLLFFDASQKVSMVDKKLAEYILEESKPVIFVANKWDLLKPLPTGDFATYLKASFPMLDFVPIAFVTAKAGRNVFTVINLAQHLHKQASARMGTSAINRVLRQALAEQSPPLRQNRRPKIFYGTQVAANPPTIVLFTNSPELFSNTYQRYLLNTFRDRLPFRDVPIKLYLRSRQGGEGSEDKDDAEETAVEPRKARSAAARSKPKRRKRSELWED